MECMEHDMTLCNGNQAIRKTILSMGTFTVLIVVGPHECRTSPDFSDTYKCFTGNFPNASVREFRCREVVKPTAGLCILGKLGRNGLPSISWFTLYD